MEISKIKFNTKHLCTLVDLNAMQYLEKQKLLEKH